MKKIIHRGITSNKIQENTYQSIKKAIRNKDTVGVEFDIRLTNDNKIVLSHDSLINLEYIENMKYSKIITKKYLTTLDKVLSINTNKILLIDIKVRKNYKIFANTLLKYLYNNQRNIYLCSFNKKIIKYLKRKSNYRLSNIRLTYNKNNDDFVMLNHQIISNKELLKIKNKEIFLWTVTSNKELKKVQNKFTNIDNYYLIIDKEE